MNPHAPHPVELARPSMFQPPHQGFSAFGLTGSPNFHSDTSHNGAPSFQSEANYDGEEDGYEDEGIKPGDNDGPEGREAKRRRIARACDMCRKKKIKVSLAPAPGIEVLVQVARRLRHIIL